MATRKKSPTTKETEEQPVAKKPEAPRAVRQVVEVIVEEDVPVNDGVDMTESDDMVSVMAAAPAPSGETEEEETVESSATAEPVIRNAMDASEDVPDLLAEEEPEESEPVVEEKRKEMVDELFQPAQPAKTDDMPARVAPPVMPDISVHKKRSVMPLLLWALIVIVVAALTGGGILLATGGGGAISLMAQPTPTPTPEAPTPTPTPVAVVKDAVNIEVLNGSGVTGAAKKMKTVLEEKGYVVEKTGNADNEDFAQSEIHVKADKEDYLTALEEDLKEAYTIGTKAADLSDDSPYDVQIIIGKE